MKKIFLLFIFFALASCDAPQQNPNFEKNVERAQEWFDKWEEEDLDYLSSKIGDEIEWQGAFYANTEYFTTKMLNGSVRTYGTWTGKNTASGKPFEVKFYHYLTFDEDGMLINGGDYGDATGVVMAVAPDPES